VFVFDHLTPTQKGNLAEAKIAAAAAEHDLHVLRPLGDGLRYDLVFDTGTRLLRVQCKWMRRTGDVLVLNARTFRLTTGGSVRTVYTADEIDLIAGYCAELDACYVLSMQQFAGRGTVHLRLAPPKNQQISGILYAKDHQFGAIAQLGERLRGTQEVVGSSPTSSTPPRQAPTVVGAHEFREKFGWFMDRARGGEEIVVSRHGTPSVRLIAATV
jgi:prevent-host-death family protein